MLKHCSDCRDGLTRCCRRAPIIGVLGATLWLPRAAPKIGGRLCKTRFTLLCPRWGCTVWVTPCRRVYPWRAARATRKSSVPTGKLHPMGARAKPEAAALFPSPGQLGAPAHLRVLFRKGTGQCEHAGRCHIARVPRYRGSVEVLQGEMCCIRAQKWKKNPVLGVWVPHQSHTFFWGDSERLAAATRNHWELG